MSDEEGRSSDFSEDEIEDDDEGTMAEEEDLDENGDVTDELRMLNEDNELSLEELRRRYYGDSSVAPTSVGTVGSPSDQPSSSSTVVVVEQKSPTVVKDYFTEDFADDDEDDDYVPKATIYWKKDVRIGDQYQVVFPLPTAKVPPASLDYKPPLECAPLWRPKRTDEEELVIREFLAVVTKKNHEQERESNGNSEDEPPQANRPPKSTAVADDEDALYAFYKNDYNPDHTLEQMPFPPANGPRITGPPIWRPMNSDEVDAFEAAFREHGKNFFLIQRNELTDRTVGELVNFYYVWKKTERHDMFVDTNRQLGIPEVGEKTIDPMDILADQQLGEGGVPLTIPTLNTHHVSSQKHWLSVQHSNNPPAQSQPPK